MQMYFVIPLTKIPASDWLKRGRLYSSLPLFACDHMTGHAEVHDQDNIYLHVTLACDFGYVEVDMIIIINLHVTCDFTAQLINYNAVITLIHMWSFDYIKVWQNFVIIFFYISMQTESIYGNRICK